MFPSNPRTDRFRPRFRPIAPKPSPFPPAAAAAPSFGTTDPSSTCASLDSLASSGKCTRRPRKRRTTDSSSVASRCPKAPSKAPIVVAASQNSFSAGGGAVGSSIWQGNSDGGVPSQDASSTADAWTGSQDVCGSRHDEGFTGEVRMQEAGDLVWANRAGIAPGGIAYMAEDLTQLGEAGRQVQRGLISMQPAVHPSTVGSFSRDMAEREGSFMEREAGVMERVAAVSQVLSEKAGQTACGSNTKGGGFVGLGFTEMIRGITRLPTTADVQSLMQGRVPSAATNPVAGSHSSPSHPDIKDMPRNRPHTPNTVVPAPPWTVTYPSPPWNAEHPAAISGLPDTLSSKQASIQYLKNLWPTSLLEADHDQYGREGGMVTLPLLPENPFKLDSHATESSLSTCTSAAAVISGLNRHSKQGADLHKCPAGTSSAPLGVVDSERREASSKQKGPAGSGAQLDWSLTPADGSYIDLAYLEQVYGASTDPILLTDETNRPLWMNRAYDKALKFCSERLSMKVVASGPYFDPLGHPTPLGRFTYQQCAKPATLKVTLWGFLKKLVVQEPEVLSMQGDGRGLQSFVCSRGNSGAIDNFNELHLRLGDDGANSTSVGKSNMQVLFHPSRVPSVTLECITDVHPHASPMLESLEAVEARLAGGSMPAFISDRMFMVRWANSAMRRILGYTDNPRAGPTNLSPPELYIICSSEMLPHSTSAFSGRVNVEWMKSGRRRSMMVPCDVCLLVATSHPTEWWVWSLDVAASLGLACGTQT